MVFKLDWIKSNYEYNLIQMSELLRKHTLMWFVDQEDTLIFHTKYNSMFIVSTDTFTTFNSY